MIRPTFRCVCLLRLQFGAYSKKRTIQTGSGSRPKGSKWSVKGYGRRLGSPIDLTLNAYRDNEKHTRITGNDDSGGGPDSVMNVTTPEEGSFLVRVSDHQKRGGDTFVWWIEVEPIVSLVKLSVPPSPNKVPE